MFAHWRGTTPLKWNVCVCVCAAVEQNLAEDNLDNLTHQQLFNQLFPLSVSAGSNPTPTESLLYRHVTTHTYTWPLIFTGQPTPYY